MSMQHPQGAKRLSARNQFAGRVSNVKEGTVMAEGTVEVQGLQVVAAITSSSVRDMQLKVNDPVTGGQGDGGPGVEITVR
jgi:molybdopterin-binding protein